MKTIIAGGRNINNAAFVEAAVKECGWKVTEVVSGGARGVDGLGEEWAAKNSVPIKVFPANWKKLGKRAGYMRNQEMAAYANALILVWDGASKGSGHMLAIARLMARNRSFKIYEKIIAPGA